MNELREWIEIHLNRDYTLRANRSPEQQYRSNDIHWTFSKVFPTTSARLQNVDCISQIEPEFRSEDLSDEIWNYLSDSATDLGHDEEFLDSIH